MSNSQDEWEQNLGWVRKVTGGEGVAPDFQKDPNPYRNPGAGGPADREARALERIADALDSIAALLASQRAPAGSAFASGGTPHGQEARGQEGYEEALSRLP